MATEEIELNTRSKLRTCGRSKLISANTHPARAGKASHIIVPAIHKTREQIADLFEEKLREGRQMKLLR